jgi:penicillin-binding protein 1A
MSETTKQPNKFIKYTKFFWKTYFYGFLGVLAYFFLTSLGILGKMPSFEELENPDANLATEIYSADNKLMGKFYKENRSPIDYSDLPKHLVDAVIATEDERFYEHSGIDARAIARAIEGRGKKGGGSTITQQLAKLLFHGEGSKNFITRIHQKVKEWIIALRLEKHYTKNEILAMYLNRADFVNHAVGIRSAARTYFRKEPRDLTLEESALFAGMLQNPSLYNPARETRIPLCIKRRNEVYTKLVRNKLIDEKKKAELSAKPIVLDFNTEDHVSGIAPYFREYLREYS